MATTTATLTLSSSDLLSDNLSLSTTMNLYKDGTTATAHLNGAEVKGIDATAAKEDSALVEEGDDFGFSGTYS